MVGRVHPEGSSCRVLGGKPREVVLNDFDGVKGRTLHLPADEQTRIFVLREQSDKAATGP